MFRIRLALAMVIVFAILPLEAQYRLPPDKHDKAVTYSRWQYALHFLGVVWTAGALVGILNSRVAPRLRNWVERKTRRQLAQAAVVVGGVLLAVDLATLPLGTIRHWLDLRYDQSVQGWLSWLWDRTKGQLIELTVAIVLGWMLYALIWRFPRSWWFRFWLALVPIVVLLLFISPVLIEPLFFEFEPLALTQPNLVKAIGTVVERGRLSIPEDRIYLMNASEKLTSLNAYVSGIGASKQVVVWDTTVAKMTPPQILFVFGHEMGHYVLGHIPQLIVFICALLLGGLFAAYRAMNWALHRWGGRWEIRGVEDWASVPLLILILTVIGFLAEPVENTVSRSYEHQADVYGIEVTFGLIPPAAETGAAAFQILGESGLEEPNPNPFIKFWLFSHPPIAERVQFAQTYNPWPQRQTRYVH